MKIITLTSAFIFISCSTDTDVKNWGMADPADGANTSANIMDTRAYTSDSLGIERDVLDNRLLPIQDKKSIQATEGYVGISRGE